MKLHFGIQSHPTHSLTKSFDWLPTPDVAFIHGKQIDPEQNKDFAENDKERLGKLLRETDLPQMVILDDEQWFAAIHRNVGDVRATQRLACEELIWAKERLPNHIVGVHNAISPATRRRFAEGDPRAFNDAICICQLSDALFPQVYPRTAPLGVTQTVANTLEISDEYCDGSPVYAVLGLAASAGFRDIVGADRQRTIINAVREAKYRDRGVDGAVLWIPDPVLFENNGNSKSQIADAVAMTCELWTT